MEREGEGKGGWKFVSCLPVMASIDILSDRCPAGNSTMWSSAFDCVLPNSLCCLCSVKAAMPYRVTCCTPIRRD